MGHVKNVILGALCRLIGMSDVHDKDQLVKAGDPKEEPKVRDVKDEGENSVAALQMVYPHYFSVTDFKALRI